MTVDVCSMLFRPTMKMENKIVLCKVCKQDRVWCSVNV